MKPTVRETLIEARAMIENPQDWSRGHGGYTRVDGTKSHCAETALGELCQGLRLEAAFYEAREVLRVAMHGIDSMSTNVPNRVAYWNDTHTHEQVLAAFDRAIESMTPPLTVPAEWIEKKEPALCS